MTRGEIEKKFTMDEGIHSPLLMRFTHPECDHFKIDVEFDFKNNNSDPNRIISSEDKVTKISKPYIERPYMD
jgi:hypothetical protein